MRFLRKSLTGLFLLSLTLGLLGFAGIMVRDAVQARMAEEARVPQARERVFAVNVVPVDFETVTPVLTSFGEVQSRRTLELRAAASGAVVELDPEFVEGGQVEAGALELFLAEPFFARMPPKSLDRNDFSEMIGLVRELGDSDAVATLTAMCAAGVAQGMEHCPKPPSRVLVTGGGRRNPVLMQMLSVSLDCPVEPVETVGLDGDMLEAQAFAYLAVRVARRLPTSCPGTTGVKALVGGGVLSSPVRNGT